jgi:hypothetical protein
MTDRPAPLSDHDIRVSLAVAAVVRAKARQAVAQADLSRALGLARSVGIDEADIGAAHRLAAQITGAGSERAEAILVATGLRVEGVSEPAREQTTELPRAEFEATLWRQGWFAGVWNEPLALARWNAPADQWKRDLFMQGYEAFQAARKAHERSQLQAVKVAAA